MQRSIKIVLKMCDKSIDCNGDVDLPEDEAIHVLDVINGIAFDALRTLRVVVKNIDETEGETNIPDRGYILIVIVGIKDHVRPGVKEAVQTCMAAGIIVCMVMGDNINKARSLICEVVAASFSPNVGLDTKMKQQSSNEQVFIQWKDHPPKGATWDDVSMIESFPTLQP